MNIVGIIPARGGSKGIPRKNIKMLAGKPLVAHTIEAAIKSKYIDKVIVSTEDNEIASISKQYGAEIVIRPVSLAQDVTKTAPVLVHTVGELERHGYIPDIIVLLQPTCPLRDEKIIDAALDKLINSDKDSIFTGFIVGPAMPLWQKSEHNDDITALYDYHLRPRRQEEHLRGTIYCENGALYAIKRDAFKEIGDFLGNDVGIFTMEYQPDIDTLEDFELAEKMLIESQASD